jgi:hypothetical protein|tara:strand:+ start:1023 stop:1586 length:564 start_codon:yes stop_codon:yes gene_type:complete
MDNNLEKMFIEDAPQDVDNLTGVENLSTLVIELQRLEDEIKNDEERLKLKKEKADKISNIAIPEIMQALKLKTMKLADGSAIEVKEVYSATIPLDKKEGAFNWLREHGLGDLIKNEVTVSFGRGEDNKAVEYADLARGQGLEPTQKLKVEPMTLKALFRERSENNEELPSEHFNLFKGNKTKITRSK